MSRIAPALRTAIPALAIGGSLVFCSLEMTGKPPSLLSNPPQLRAKNHTLSLTLHAAIASDGKNSFYFHGQRNAPTLRLSPGDQLKISYINDLPTRPQESCAITPCMDMTNLHFHGLTVSPNTPQDEAKTQDAAVVAAEHSLNLSTTRYRGNVAAYLEVITAQGLGLSDERTAVQILGRRMVASVLLIKALGGGWNASNLQARN